MYSVWTKGTYPLHVDAILNKKHSEESQKQPKFTKNNNAPHLYLSTTQTQPRKALTALFAVHDHTSTKTFFMETSISLFYRNFFLWSGVEFGGQK
tara:strand:- start:325 stop:609 length:285 start_codon:yes stop_codon:yes gene_type:complete